MRRRFLQVIKYSSAITSASILLFIGDRHVDEMPLHSSLLRNLKSDLVFLDTVTYMSPRNEHLVELIKTKCLQDLTYMDLLLEDHISLIMSKLVSLNDEFIRHVETKETIHLGLNAVESLASFIQTYASSTTNLHEKNHLCILLLSKMDTVNTLQISNIIQEDQDLYSEKLKIILNNENEKNQVLMLQFLLNLFKSNNQQIFTFNHIKWILHFISDTLKKSKVTCFSLQSQVLLLIEPIVHQFPSSSLNYLVYTLNVHESIRDLYINVTTSKATTSSNDKNVLLFPISNSLKTLTKCCSNNKEEYMFESNQILEEEIEVPLGDDSHFPIIKYTHTDEKINWVDILLNLSVSENQETSINATQGLLNIIQNTRHSQGDEVILQQWLVYLLLHVSKFVDQNVVDEMHSQLSRVNGKLWYRFGLSPHVINKKLQRQTIRALALCSSEKDISQRLNLWGGNELIEALQSLNNKTTTSILDKQLSRVIANLTSHNLQEINEKYSNSNEWSRTFMKWKKSLNLKVRYHTERIQRNLLKNTCDFYGDGLFILYPELIHHQDEVLNHSLDIVFVHGLGGSPLKTWKLQNNDYYSIKDEDLYIKEWIPKDIEMENCLRIMSVDYRAHMFSWDSPKRHLSRQESALHLLDLLYHAGVARDEKRRVIFIVHSQGGLLIKELLTLKNNQKDDSYLSKLLENTKSIIFLGTPHLGNYYANLAPEYLHDILYNPSLPFKQLRPGDELNSLNDKFCKIIDKFNIKSFSFGEGKPTKLVGGNLNVFIVPNEYANPKCGNFEIITEADHLDINKPTDRNDVRYTTLIKAIHDSLQ